MNIFFELFNQNLNSYVYHLRINEISFFEQVKWYKGTHEFYRYSPREEAKLFLVENLDVDVSVYWILNIGLWLCKDIYRYMYESKSVLSTLHISYVNQMTERWFWKICMLIWLVVTRARFLPKDFSKPLWVNPTWRWLVSYWSIYQIHNKKIIIFACALIKAIIIIAARIILLHSIMCRHWQVIYCMSLYLTRWHQCR